MSYMQYHVLQSMGDIHGAARNQGHIFRWADKKIKKGYAQRFPIYVYNIYPTYQSLSKRGVKEARGKN